MGINLAHWVGNAVKAAGRDVGSGAKFVDKETGKIAKDIDKVPFVGPLFVGVVDLYATPFKFGTQVLEGKNIVQSVVKDLKSDLKDVKEIAPYAQMVISFVPGIGPVVSGAIGAGVALVEGQPISEVAIAAVKGAIPGGPLAASIFSAAVTGASAIASHEDVATAISKTALAALPIPPEAQAGINSAIGLARSVARGEKPAQALLDAADKNIASLGIPVEAKKALTIGIAMAHGKVTQAGVQKAVPGALAKLQAVGHAVVLKDPVVAAASKTAPSVRGFEIGMGVMQHQIGVASFQAVRNQMKGADLKAFDIATSLHVGRVTTTPAAPSAAPAAVASAAITATGMPPTTYPVALATGAGVATMAVLALLEAPVLVAWGAGAAVAGVVLFIKRH